MATRPSEPESQADADQEPETDLNRDTAFFRNPEVTGFGSADRFTFHLPSGQAVSFSGNMAPVVRQVFATVHEPKTDTQIVDELPAIAAQHVQHALSRLTEHEILLSGSLSQMRTARSELDHKAADRCCDHLILGVSGAIQAADMSGYLDRLYSGFCYELEIILTDAARRFVSTQALEHVYGCSPWVDMFATRGGVKVPHIHLAHWADLVVIVPASAHTIHKLATGACADLLSLVVAATDAPVVVVPSMNRAMWNHPSVQRNADQLRSDGLYLVEPGFGWEVSARPGEATIGPPGASPSGLLAVLADVLKRSQEAQTS